MTHLRFGPFSLLQEARKYCPHHVGHYLGMDVHDTDEISRNIKLQPGMIVTIEPGKFVETSTGWVNMHIKYVLY